MNVVIAADADDITAKHAIATLPALEEVELALRGTACGVAFYDPAADAKQPWLWLDTPSGPMKIYAALDAADLRRVARAESAS